MLTRTAISAAYSREHANATVVNHKENDRNTTVSTILYDYHWSETLYQKTITIPEIFRRVCMVTELWQK